MSIERPTPPKKSTEGDVTAQQTRSSRPPGVVVVEALKKVGIPEDKLGPDHLQLIKEINEATALLKEEHQKS